MKEMKTEIKGRRTERNEIKIEERLLENGQEEIKKIIFFKNQEKNARRKSESEPGTRAPDTIRERRT